jgi:hypothetical protein
MPTLDQIMTWVKDNQLMVGLVASAVIGAMPELLPTWKTFPQWMWTWFRDSAKTFLNFRRQMTEPTPPTVQQQRLNAAQQGNQATHNAPEVKPQQLNG